MPRRRDDHFAKASRSRELLNVRRRDSLSVPFGPASYIAGEFDPSSDPRRIDRASPSLRAFTQSDRKGDAPRTVSRYFTEVVIASVFPVRGASSRDRPRSLRVSSISLADSSRACRKPSGSATPVFRSFEESCRLLGAVKRFDQRFDFGRELCLRRFDLRLIESDPVRSISDRAIAPRT